MKPQKGKRKAKKARTSTRRVLCLLSQHVNIAAHGLTHICRCNHCRRRRGQAVWEGVIDRLRWGISNTGQTAAKLRQQLGQSSCVRDERCRKQAHHPLRFQTCSDVGD